MAEPGWPRHVFSLGFFEFRRSVRALWQDKARFALMTLGVLIPSLMGTVFVVVFADAIRSIETLPVPEQLRGTIALFWLFAVFLIDQRVVSARTRIEAESLMLTTVSARTVAGGLLVAEILRMLAYLGSPILVLTGVGVFLFGSPASLILIPMAALLFMATAAVTGTVSEHLETVGHVIQHECSMEVRTRRPRKRAARTVPGQIATVAVTAAIPAARPRCKTANETQTLDQEDRQHCRERVDGRPHDGCT